MKAQVTYEMHYGPHPWDDKRRASGIQIWALWEVTTPEVGPKKSEAVAIFNYDSDAERFQAQVFAAGLDGQLVTIDRDTRELFTMLKQRRQR